MPQVSPVLRDLGSYGRHDSTDGGPGLRAGSQVCQNRANSKWVRLTAPHLKVPPQLNRAHCTPQQARAGLAESAARCAEMLAEALGGCEGGRENEGRVEKFRRDGWASPWPVGPEMLCYMLSHEAHHHGQVCILAHHEPGGVRDLELGKAVERVRVAGRPRIRFLSNRSS